MGQTRRRMEIGRASNGDCLPDGAAIPGRGKLCLMRVLDSVADRVYVGAFRDEEVAEVLQLPAEEEPLTLLSVGKPAGE